MRVIVSHPGVQHSHQLAWALEEAGYLQAYWSGVPARSPQEAKSMHFRFFGPALREIPVPARKRRHFVIFPILHKLLGIFLSSRAAHNLTHRLDHAYDWLVARWVAKANPDMVVCYENAALRTFKAAKATGALCVLDAASVHYAFAAKWLKDVGEVDADWISRQKQQEIDLADAILTCSPLAAETYIASGVPAEKVSPVVLGTDLPNLGSIQRTENLCNKIKFVFVGTLRALKGVDWLLEIFAESERDALPISLTMIGGVADKKLANRARILGNVRHIDFVPQNRLFDLIAEHDCLVLPSRFDSFAMVVPEALAAGVPVMISERVGAKCIVEAHPDCGWIVAANAGAFKEKIIELIESPQLLENAKRAARGASGNYTWGSYRKRVVEILSRVYEARHG